MKIYKEGIRSPGVLSCAYLSIMPDYPIVKHIAGLMVSQTSDILLTF